MSILNEISGKSMEKLIERFGQERIYVIAKKFGLNMNSYTSPFTKINLQDIFPEYTSEELKNMFYYFLLVTLLGTQETADVLLSKVSAEKLCNELGLGDSECKMALAGRIFYRGIRHTRTISKEGLMVEAQQRLMQDWIMDAFQRNPLTVKKILKRIVTSSELELNAQKGQEKAEEDESGEESEVQHESEEDESEEEEVAEAEEEEAEEEEGAEAEEEVAEAEEEEGAEAEEEEGAEAEEEEGAEAEEEGAEAEEEEEAEAEEEEGAEAEEEEEAEAEEEEGGDEEEDQEEGDIEGLEIMGMKISGDQLEKLQGLILKPDFNRSEVATYINLINPALKGGSKVGNAESPLILHVAIFGLIITLVMYSIYLLCFNIDSKMNDLPEVFCTTDCVRTEEVLKFIKKCSQEIDDPEIIKNSYLASLLKSKLLGKIETYNEFIQDLNKDEDLINTYETAYNSLMCLYYPLGFSAMEVILEVKNVEHQKEIDFSYQLFRTYIKQLYTSEKNIF